MAKKSPKRRKRALTAQEQEQFLMAVEGLPLSERAGFIISKGYTPPWYYNMRKRYLTRHPELNLDEAPATPVTTLSKDKTFFKDATKAQKFRMIAEYDALPKVEKKPWRIAHNVKDALMVYYRKQFPSASTALVTTSNGSPTDTNSLLAEYDSLSRGEKTQWLKDRGMTYQNIYDLRYRLKRSPQEATERLPRKRPSANGLYPQVLPPAAPPPLTVDDMITAFKVERDMLNETIAKMERMKATHQ